ncbi:MAG TPA: chemotaxis protein CheB, partial [Gemmataceae bacterium]|nr:chemotaxis protein CheB [Gemmataceae bacterium]
MPNHDIVTIGASAGGVQALRNFVNRLPKDLPVAIFVVLHVPPQWPSQLAQILTKSGPLPALAPEDHARIEPGHIYVATPDKHLLVEPDEIRVIRGPRENRHRPGVDPLFRSAAWAYGPRVVGVVLSGTLDDGASGLWAIKSCGGIAVVQDPADAIFPEMPTNAMMNVQVDHCLPVDDIATLIAKL